MPDTRQANSQSVCSRLIQAARECFLADEYHNVTTRQIAKKAEANAAMIRYYFGSKEGLYEEMFRETMAPLLDVLDSPAFQSADGFGALLHIYYQTMTVHPEFPKLILRVLALNQGPGRRFVLQLIERGRSQGAKRIAELKGKGEIASSLTPDVIRMAFVSLAMTPMLLKEVFEQQWGHVIEPEFMRELAEFNGRMFAAGLALAADGPQQK